MNPIAGVANTLKPFKTVRKPGSVKFLWDMRLLIVVFLVGQIGTLALLLYLFLFMMKPTEGHEEFLATWGLLLLIVIGAVVFTAIFLKLQGAIQVNQTQSRIEIFKGFGLSKLIHSLYFDTLEKIVLTSPLKIVSGLVPSQKLVYEQIGLYLKTGEEIQLPFAQLAPEEALKVVKEIAEAAGVPAFDREGNPIHSLEPLGSPA
jgi:hypothetical protein